MERTHGELCTGLTDGLGRVHAYSLAAIDKSAGGQVAAVTHDANAALRFAGQHRANLDALDTGCVNRGSQLFGDLLVDAYDHVAFVIALVFESHAAHNAVAQRLDDFARFDNRLDEDAFGGAAIGLGDDDVLRDVHQTPREVAGIRRLESGIGQTLAGAVRGDEVLQHVQPF